MSANLTRADLGWLRVRRRDRLGYVKEAQRHMAWTEYQIVLKQRVISRHDTEAQANLAFHDLRKTIEGQPS